MPDYSKAKIYKLICDATDDIYIGSTVCPLYKRLSTHKCNGQKCRSSRLFQQGHCDIISIEDYPCNRKEQLHARERYWMENSGNVINRALPTRTQKEYRNSNEEHWKEYDKQYYQAHKTERKVYYRKYREDHKEQLYPKVICDNCGASICKHGLAKHKRTKRCIQTSSKQCGDLAG